MKKQTAKLVEDRQTQPRTYAKIVHGEDGWYVAYPDPGWVDCGPLCAGCDHQPGKRDQGWINSEARFPTQAQALRYAEWLGYEEVR